jgi:hypothetical protein
MKRKLKQTKAKPQTMSQALPRTLLKNVEQINGTTAQILALLSKRPTGVVQLAQIFGIVSGLSGIIGLVIQALKHA